MVRIVAGGASALALILSVAASAPLAAQSAAEPSAKRLEIVPGITRGKAGLPAEKDRSAYLLAYFKDETHSLHFAVSSDGYSFTDVNDGAPVLNGRDVAEQKGVRDPHIMRGPDGAFYLSMTDLHIFAKREGLRQKGPLARTNNASRPRTSAIRRSKQKAASRPNEDSMRLSNG